MSGVGRGGPQNIPRPAQSRPGTIPEWMEPPVESPSINLAHERIASYQPSELLRGPAVQRPAQSGRKSAVLVALFEGEKGATTILTRRPLHMRKHAGEIAFPGGAHDTTDDSLWHTAIREAEEEVGLDPSLPTMIGEIDRFVTGASFSLVQPIVARLEEPPVLVAAPDEVDEILYVPLVELLTPGVYRQEQWLWDNEWRDMHFFDLIGDTVWGATALMLHNLLDVVARHPPPN